MSCWYKPGELSKRVAMFYTANMSAGAFGGLLAGGIIEGMEGLANTRGWKWLFIIEGLMTVVAAVVAFFVLPNYPATTKWLTPEEKKLASARLLSGVPTEEEEPHVGHWTAFKQACKDPKTWVFVLMWVTSRHRGYARARVDSPATTCSTWSAPSRTSSPRS
jgi:MFS family permease